LHNHLIIETPARLGQRRRFTLADQQGDLIARSSRLAEPFICEAVDAVLRPGGRVRLLEIGCGSAAYIRYAAARNPELTAVGLELQPDLAALARDNIARWKLTDRVTIEVADILQRAPEAVFDLATLHQNIYYFPMDARLGALRHVRAFLKPGGRLLLTTVCLGRGAAVDVLNLWATMTEGCGPLPTPAEMVAQMENAGFMQVTNRSLIPRDSFYAFVGIAP
jgi:4-hydroxy-2,2'-bipyrrole-5-carbaldehyde O-methyltransferase